MHLQSAFMLLHHPTVSQNLRWQMQFGCREAWVHLKLLHVDLLDDIAFMCHLV